MVPTALPWEHHFIQDTELVENQTSWMVAQLQALAGLQKMLVADEGKDTLESTDGKRKTNRKMKNCEVCKKTFSNLKQHQLTHTRERPFKCNQCNKAFSQAAHLKVHQRSHTGEKPYTCHQCKKTFIVSSHLKSHMRSHTDEKSFKCNPKKEALSPYLKTNYMCKVEPSLPKGGKVAVTVATDRGVL